MPKGTVRCCVCNAVDMLVDSPTWPPPRVVCNRCAEACRLFQEYPYAIKRLFEFVPNLRAFGFDLIVPSEREGGGTPSP